MHHLIDIYTKHGGRWVYRDATRMHATLAGATRAYEAEYGCKVLAKFA